MAPHHLGISPIEIDYLDVLFGFDLAFGGNHDEIIAESLFAESPLTCLTEEHGARPVDFQPTVTVALSDDCRLQARIDVVTRTNSYQVRTGDYSDDVISVYLILRRYWGDRPKEPMETLFTQMAERAEQLCTQLHRAPRAPADLVGDRVAVVTAPDPRHGARPGGAVLRGQTRSPRARAPTPNPPPKRAMAGQAVQWRVFAIINRSRTARNRAIPSHRPSQNGPSRAAICRLFCEVRDAVHDR